MVKTSVVWQDLFNKTCLGWFLHVWPAASVFLYFFILNNKYKSENTFLVNVQIKARKGKAPLKKKNKRLVAEMRGDTCQGIYDKNMTNAVKKISSGVWYQHHWPWPQLLWQAGRQQPFPEQQAAASSPRLQVPRPFLAPPPSRTQAKFTPKLCRELKINFSKRKRPQCESADQQGQECQTDTREDSHVIIST